MSQAMVVAFEPLSGPLWGLTLRSHGETIVRTTMSSICGFWSFWFWGVDGVLDLVQEHMAPPILQQDLRVEERHAKGLGVCGGSTMLAAMT